MAFPDYVVDRRVVARLKGVGKRYGDREVLSGIDFVLETMDRVAILGPNGSGKTTLLQLVTGGLDPTKGKAYRNGAVKVGIVT